MSSTVLCGVVLCSVLRCGAVQYICGGITVLYGNFLLTCTVYLIINDKNLIFPAI